MASCDHWFYAEDQDGNYPSAVDPEFVLRNFHTGNVIGTYSIPSYGLKLILDNTIKYTAIPLLDTGDEGGWVRPDDVDFYGCAKDITFVWERKICTPGAKKCIGDNVYTCNSDGTEWRYTENCPGGCSGGKCIELPIGNGFSIRVSDTLATKNVLVAHVVKMPFLGVVGPDPDLWYWPQAFDYVGGKWYMTDPATTYRVEVGSIFETIPSFDKTYGTGSFADGIHCVVLAEGEGGVGSLIFKGEDVFQLFGEIPTEIYLSSTSTDVLTEAIMGPVCDFFGIPRGSACNSFWAEFYDPVYVANYISIMRTGKDTLGNDRQLSGFDHIALPFAILGSLPGLSLLPFGAMVTRGLGTAAKFSDAAVQFMLNFSMDAAGMVSSKDTWHFLDAIGQVTEGHATEIVNALTAGDTNLANTLLRRYAGESKGWWDYHELNDMLQNALPADAYNWLRTQIGLTEIGAGTVTNTAKQATLSADDIAKLADAAKDSGVMDEATAAVYNSLKNMDAASTTKIGELKNILKNSPELSAKLVAKHKSILDNIVAGGSITKDEVVTILNHAEVAPDDIVGLFKSIDPRIIPILRDGTYSQSLGNYIYAIRRYHDAVKGLGDINADSWVKNNAELAGKALDSTEPAKMADIPKTAQDFVADSAPLIDDLGTTTMADEIVSATDEFVGEATTSWKDKGIGYVDRMMDSIFRKAKGEPRKPVHYADSDTRFEKWKSIYHNLEDWQKFTFWTMIAWGTYEIASFYGGFVVPKILGVFPGQASGRQIGHNENMKTAGWHCKAACDQADVPTLVIAIENLKTAITDAESHINSNKTEFEIDGSYAGFANAIEGAKLTLTIAEECLAALRPSGNIKCTSNQSGFAVYLDGDYINHSYGNTWLVIPNVAAGQHTVKIEKGTGYSPEYCEKTVTVSENIETIVDCQMTETGVSGGTIKCTSNQTGFSVYIDDVYIDHSYGNTYLVVPNITAGSHKVKIEKGTGYTPEYCEDNVDVIDGEITDFDCQMIETVEPPAESTTLQIETPIGTDGNEIPRYWEIEIWVDGKDTACNPPKTLTFGTNVFCDCTSPWNLVPCELGQHTITLRKYGYDDKSVSIYLEKDIPATWMSPVMVKSVAPPPERTINIVVPVGSALYVDGKSIPGTTTVGRLTTIFNDLRK